MTQDPQNTKQCRGVHATLAGEVVVVVSGWWTIDIVMAADGRDRKTIGGNPRLVPALPHSTPAQNRFQTSFPLSRLGTQDYCAHIAEISASRRTLGGTRAALLSPTLTTLRLSSRHLPTPEILCIYEFVKFNPELWAAWDHTAHTSLDRTGSRSRRVGGECWTAISLGREHPETKPQA